MLLFVALRAWLSAFIALLFRVSFFVLSCPAYIHPKTLGSGLTAIFTYNERL